MMNRKAPTEKTLTDRASNDADKNPLWKRVAWLIAIWCGSVLALGVVAGLMRALMKMAGLTLH